MNNLKFETQFYYENPTTFPKKLGEQIKNEFDLCRDANHYAFNDYVNISFDSEDKRHQYPILTSSQTTAYKGLLFDVIDYPYDKYDKMVIYYVTLKRLRNCRVGIIFYNTKTNEYFHYNDISTFDVVRYCSEFLNSRLKSKIFN